MSPHLLVQLLAEVFHLKQTGNTGKYHFYAVFFFLLWLTHVRGFDGFTFDFILWGFSKHDINYSH